MMEVATKKGKFLKKPLIFACSEPRWKLLWYIISLCKHCLSKIYIFKLWLKMFFVNQVGYVHRTISLDNEESRVSLKLGNPWICIIYRKQKLFC